MRRRASSLGVINKNPDRIEYAPDQLSAVSTRVGTHVVVGCPAFSLDKEMRGEGR